MKHDIPELRLFKHDRVEPSVHVPDVSKLEEIVDAATFPTDGLRVTFWRRDAESRTKHRNPIFDPSIGIVLDIVIPGELHMLNLGPLKVFCFQLVCLFKL